MVEMTCGEDVFLRDEDYEGSFAFRAALALGVYGFHAGHEPGSRGDFIQALQLLGADPKLHWLQSPRNTHKLMRAHVSCWHDDWAKVFGQPECIEEISAASTNNILHRWKHFCSDGEITCVGHLFEHSPGVLWVVLMRVAFL